MLKRATLICPRCKLAGEMTIKENVLFPNKCDKCGSTNVMVTHLTVGIREHSELAAEKRKIEAINKAAQQAAEVMAATLLKA